MSKSTSLGEVRQVSLPQATISYRERGTGQPVVFVHGVFVNGDLWRNVVPRIAEAGFRCITPDWPFGSQEVPANPDADLTPPGIARMIADFLEALDLTSVVLVANDTGGAFSQIAVVNHAERIERLVLTPSDSLNRFFPPMFGYLQVLGRIPGSAFLVAQTLRLRFLHRLPLVFGWLSKRPIPADIMSSYLTPMRKDRRVRRDLGKVIQGVDKRHTLAAAKRFPQTTIPVLLAWSREDRLFPLSLAEQLRDLFPHALLEPIDDAYTYVPEDRPDTLAELVVQFAEQPAR